MKTKVAFPVFHRIFFPLINALVYVHYISREKEKACERLDVTTVSNRYKYIHKMNLHDPG